MLQFLEEGEICWLGSNLGGLTLIEAMSQVILFYFGSTTTSFKNSPANLITFT